MSNQHDDHDSMSLPIQVALAGGELSLTPLQCISRMHEEHRRNAHSCKHEIYIYIHLFRYMDILHMMMLLQIMKMSI